MELLELEGLLDIGSVYWITPLKESYSLYKRSIPSKFHKY